MSGGDIVMAMIEAKLLQIAVQDRQPTDWTLWKRAVKRSERCVPSDHR